MGSCCSKDHNEKTSWSPYGAKSHSTTSTIIAQPLDYTSINGVYTLKRTTTTTTATTDTNNAKTHPDNPGTRTNSSTADEPQSIDTETIVVKVVPAIDE